MGFLRVSSLVYRDLLGLRYGLLHSAGEGSHISPEMRVRGEKKKKKELAVYKKFVFSNVSLKLKINSVALVRKRTIPAERPLLVGEVSANFCG
jgi:hypothetical protein